MMMITQRLRRRFCEPHMPFAQLMRYFQPRHFHAAASDRYFSANTDDTGISRELPDDEGFAPSPLFLIAMISGRHCFYDLRFI